MSPRVPTNERTWRWAQRWDGQGKAHLAHRDWPNHSAGHTACGLGFPRGEDNGVVPADDNTPRCGNCLRTVIPVPTEDER